MAFLWLIFGFLVASFFKEPKRKESGDLERHFMPVRGRFESSSGNDTDADVEGSLQDSELEAGRVSLCLDFRFV